MKRTLSFLLISTSLALAASSDPDLTKGIDFTGQASITAGMLNQLVDNGTIRSNRGILLVTNGVPNVAAFNRYTNYIWLDTSVNPRALKYWITPGALNLATCMQLTNWASLTAAGGGAIDGAALLAGSVTGDKIASGTLSNGHYAINSINSSKIADGAIITAKIDNQQVTREKLALLSITGAQIDYASIDAGRLAANSVYGTNIGPNTITYANIAAATIQASNIAAGVIGTNAIADSSITAEKIALTTIGGTNLQNNTISNGNIADLTITGSKIADGAITTAKMASTNFFPSAAVIFVPSDNIAGFSNAFAYASNNVSYVRQRAIDGGIPANLFRVAFTTPMTTTNYAVLATRRDGSTVAVTNVLTTSFELFVSNTTDLGGTYNPQVGTNIVDVMVFGR